MKEIMTPEERLQATIRVEPVDRVCCAPLIEQYAGQFAGMTNHEFLFNWDKCMAAIDRVKEAYPVWDCNRGMQQVRYGPQMKVTGTMRCKLPGVDLDENAQYQFIETEIMTREDYRMIREKGYREYRNKFLQESHGVTREQVLEGLRLVARLRDAERDASFRRGQSHLYGLMAGVVPFDALSMTRSIEKFFKDMFQIGGEVEELIWIINGEVIEAIIRGADAVGVRRVFIGAVRCASQFISKKYFERFAWPQLKVMVEKLVEKDIVPILHFDSDWTLFLEYFLDLPRGKFILELDSATDIFKAKEILKGHCCLLGDVSPALFTVGSAAEMDEYCRKLITVVGKDGGLIYSSGCSLPMNARHENVKVFFEAVEKYGRY